jgi:hypothetical protein
MAKADTEDLAAQAAKRAEFRVHHVGTKLNERGGFVDRRDAHFVGADWR